jgi:hypothetical protein
MTINSQFDDLLQPLYARGFINDTENGPEISTAGVLLFTKKPLVQPPFRVPF